MSFEMKYDREGYPISPAPVVEEATQKTVEEVSQEPVQESLLVENEQQEESEEITSTPIVAQKESEQARNFRAIREKAEKAERERDELLRRLQEVETRSKPSQVSEDEPDIHIGDEDLVEGKHLRKYNKEIQTLKEQLKVYQKQTAETVIEAKIKSQYNDFDSVVNADNIEILRSAYPEIAHTLNANPDLYSKAVSAYTLIKKLGIHQDASYKEDVARAQKNAAKPRPLSSVSPQQGDSPLSKANAFANGLTEDLKKQLYQEMLNARRMN